MGRLAVLGSFGGCRGSASGGVGLSAVLGSAVGGVGRLAAAARVGWRRLGSAGGGVGYGRGMLAAFSVTPLGGPNGDEVGKAVAEAVRIVRASGLPNETNAMFTNLEGDWDEVMRVIKACLDRLAEDAPRVTAIIKLDIRPGHDGALTEKVATVERYLRE